MKHHEGYPRIRFSQRGLVRFLSTNVLILCLFVTSAVPAHADPKAIDPSSRNNRTKELAIVIDDLGNQMAGTKDILSLPIHLTVAVMPFMRTTKQDATLAHERGNDVLIHLPMEPNQGKPEWLGPGAILSNMTDSEIRQRVEEAIDDVPYAIGINNHMGSKITSDERIMSIILDVCREHGLFFLDSRTSFKTVVGKLCLEKGMPVIGNQFFLDDIYSLPHIQRQMSKVTKWMKQHDRCIIIGHVGVPGTRTASVIRNAIPELDKEVKFVKISEMYKGLKGSQILGPRVTLP